MNITKLLSSTALVCAAVAFVTPAYAQGTASTGAEQDDPATLQSEVEVKSGQDADAGTETEEAIVVTGSRIRRPNLDSAVPITSINAEEFFETGNVSVGDALNELPQLRTTLGQQNSTAGLGTAGLNLLDLRGLGTSRTLVLVNGRRHVGSDILFNAVSPDTNTFPTALIERTELITGGNSAVYGSDAVAGVVNFILRRDYDGIEARAQGGVSDYGDAGAYFASITAGKNFGDGRGNVAISAEYARQDQYFGAGRPFLASQDAFLTIDTDIRCTGTSAAGTPTPVGCDPNVNERNGDGNPDRTFFRDIRGVTSSNTGVIQFAFNTPTATANGGRDPVGNFYSIPYIFQPDGSLVPITGTRVGLGPTGSFIGGNGENFRGGEQLQLSPAVDRYVVNLLGHFEFSDAFEIFGEAKYARSDALGSGSSGPAFVISNGLGGDVRQAFRLDNPFLSAQARTTIVDQLNATGRTTGTVAGGSGALSAADRAAIANGTFRVRFQESFLNIGGRFEEFKRETYRGVVGIRGEFNTDWNYEVSANYGEFKETNLVGGNVGRQRLLLALDAGRDPATGQIRCRSQFDPAAATGFRLAGPTNTAAQNAAILAADISACVPINPFGGNFTDAQRDYLVRDTTSNAKITQFVAQAFVSGDSSEQFELPGGPVGFVLGLEYRRETNFFEADPLVQQNFTFYNALSTFESPAFDVKEVFGELRLPILRDVPFFNELTASGAARYAYYEGGTGGVLAWNAGLEWAPIRDLRLRANLSRAVRAPNLGELFSATTPGFTPAPADPCSLRNRSTGAATRAANCLALGVPANFDYIYTGSLTINSGGNPDLKEESSDSLTVGGVLQPRFLPGLALSVDYFDIEVKDVITAVGAQTIINQCVDSATINNPFCGQFRRNTGPGLGPSGEEVGRILEGSLLQSVLNFASRRARGIDSELNYRTRVGDLGRIDLRVIYTHNIERSNFENPADPNFENVLLQELGNPKDELSLRANLSKGAFNFVYNLRYIGKQYLNTFEDYNSLNGLPAQNEDYADVKFYPDVFYHNFRVGFDVEKKYNFYVGIDNAFNKKPPFGLTGIGAGSGIFDNRGRYFYAGARATF